ncbi:hypothetical protein [Nonomuraea wenchangensis]|uniref:hypothetical protein n=1 Tax=Nonomuraea wenchangensis TaxID=568860 RepID=UPI00333322AE
MGTSTNAMLAYGYDLGSADGWKIREAGEFSEPILDWYDEDSDDGFIEQAEARLLAAHGLTGTWEDDGYYDRKEEAQARAGVEFDSYCHSEYPMWLLATKVITVHRGDSEVLDLPALMAETAENGWDDKLRQACEVLGITPKQERPGWVLVSYWG